MDLSSTQNHPKQSIKQLIKQRWRPGGDCHFRGFS